MTRARLAVGAALLVVFCGAGPTAALAPRDLGSADSAGQATATAVRLSLAPASTVVAGEQPVAPLNFPMQSTPRCDILDNFGDPRSGGRTHEGADLLATKGQEVYAMADGTLTHQTIDGTGGSSALSGNLWELTAADGTTYLYMHLSGFATGLQKGSKVVVGQLLGYVGDTGNPGAGNYHLHFEIHPRGGAAVNPLPLLTIPSACKVW